MRRQRLAVDNDVIAISNVEGKSEMALQRRMRLANAVEPGDLSDDVARRLVVAPKWFTQRRTVS